MIPTLKPNLEKVLYLDCDILVTDSLSDLWSIDINNYYCAVVEEMYEKTHNDAKRLGVEAFFNAGVLLLNNKKWVYENIQEMWKNIFDKVS